MGNLENTKINISIKVLKGLAKQLNRCPKVSEFEAIEHNGYKRRTLERKLNLKYNDICKKYLPNYKLNHGELNITLEDIDDKLIEINNQLGRIPLVIELEKYGLPHPSTIKRKFNLTYNQLFEKVGLKPTRLTTLEKSEDELLAEFYSYFKELKRIPTFKELNNNNKTATSTTYIKYFGSIKNVCTLLGIDYALYHKGSGMGNIYLDKNDEICKSLPEMYISNFLIANNIIFEKGTSYSEIINKDKRQFDWKININDDIYYVEYFGLYNRKPRGNIDRKYSNNTKKKIKDLYKKEIINNCIFIFPWDLINRKLSDVFKYYLKTNLTDIPFEKDIKALEYNLYPDEDLLDIVMEYSDNSNILPNTILLAKNNVSVYNEILKRYDSYFIFADKMGKQVINMPNNYWTEENVFELFKYMLNKYNKIVTKRDKDILKLDYRCKGLRTIESNYGWINIKLKFFNHCVDNNITIPDYELNWLNKVATNTGSGIKGHISKEQQELANYILRINTL